MTTQHPFTERILHILEIDFGSIGALLLESNLLLQYINNKTRSVNRGSKSRGSFANLYAIYVLIEDYLTKGHDESGDYSLYEGVIFSQLFKRQRELPFGSKLQNHALNHRMNEEFKKFFPTSDLIPIIRDVSTNRYWINERLLIVDIDETRYNLARSVLKIIDGYIKAKMDAFEQFIETCKTILRLQEEDAITARNFVSGLLAPNIDARIFEIVSYAILKYYYHDQSVYFGFQIDRIEKESLKLYKTGRTNANDGGIDFVMKPLGRFFQVTETLDVRKYFLDIDKIERYPVTFVIKSNEDKNELRIKLAQSAERQYPVKAIINRYMESIEEIINIPIMISRFADAVDQGHLEAILEEIIQQSKVEFNYEDDIE
ncbi:restriction endonuclease [Candidatus Roizmanbacteria bacterium]|nr:restriction endonuclease [Candidatus Roizmanbacteria bacterium]